MILWTITATVWGLSFLLHLIDGEYRIALLSLCAFGMAVELAVLNNK